MISKETVDIGGSYPRRGPQHRPRDPCRQSTAQPRHCRALGNHHVSLHHFICSKSPCFLWFWLPFHFMACHQVDAHADINTPASSTSGNMHGMPVKSPTSLSSTYYPCSGEFSSSKPQFRPDSLDRSTPFPAKVFHSYLKNASIFYLSRPCSALKFLFLWFPGLLTWVYEMLIPLNRLCLSLLGLRLITLRLSTTTKWYYNFLIF